MDPEDRVWLLTTVDNPYSPFDDFRRWYQRDTALGYNTCGLIDRLANASDEFDDDSDYEVMRLITKYNWSGKHIMVTEDTWLESINLPV